MRIATYNIEWFNKLFDDQDKLCPDDRWSGRYDVTRRAQSEALGHVFSAIDADAIMIIEAPDNHRTRSSVAALEDFAKVYGLRTSQAVTGFANDTQQEISLLFDPAQVSAVHDPVQSDTAPRFDTEFNLDVDVDSKVDPIRFSKPPLELVLNTRKGTNVRLIGVHLKSKAPHGARNKASATRISIENRRKQLAQCIWLHHRVLDHAAKGDALIVLGDLNDGPGLDEYEKLFGRSGVEIVLGEGSEGELFDPHARMAITQKMGVQPATSRFYLSDQKRYLSALLDYIMVSSDLKAKSPIWRIWHPFDDPECYGDAELRNALLTGSDHFPVTIDLEL
ncbi:MAG: endonuclease/exonuclease/phosphatase family protein [Pseudoruegeria sp.]